MAIVSQLDTHKFTKVPVDAVWNIAISPTDDHIAVWEPNRVILVDLSTFAQIDCVPDEFSPPDLYDLHFSSDGKQLIVVQQDPGADAREDLYCTVWNLGETSTRRYHLPSFVICPQNIVHCIDGELYLYQSAYGHEGDGCSFRVLDLKRPQFAEVIAVAEEPVISADGRAVFFRPEATPTECYCLHIPSMIRVKLDHSVLEEESPPSFCDRSNFVIFKQEELGHSAALLTLSTASGEPISILQTNVSTVAVVTTASHSPFAAVSYEDAHGHSQTYFFDVRSLTPVGFSLQHLWAPQYRTFSRSGNLFTSSVVPTDTRSEDHPHEPGTIVVTDLRGPGPATVMMKATGSSGSGT